MGMGHALLGATLGVGIGEGLNALHGDGYGPAPRSRGGIPKNGYTNPISQGEAARYADSLIAQANQSNAPEASAMGAVGALMGASGAGPIGAFAGGMTANPYTPDPNDPDKFDTVLGDALQTQRKAQTYRAVSDAARLGEILGQKQISRQQASDLIQQFHQKHPTINIPIQPYTSEQARELRGRALLAQKQDEAEAMGMGREAYTADPTTGLPVINPLAVQKRAMDVQAATAERQRRHELRLAKLADEKDQRAEKRDALKLADEIFKMRDEALGKRPDEESASPEQIKAWENKKTDILNARTQLRLPPPINEPTSPVIRGSLVPKKRSESGATITKNDAMAEVTRTKADAEGLTVVMDDQDKETLQPNQVFYDARDGRKYRWQYVEADNVTQVAERPLSEELDSRLNKLR